jgi:hypothetical protein
MSSAYAGSGLENVSAVLRRAMTSTPHIIVKLTPGITPEQARDTRALALRFALDCYTKKKDGPATALDARKEINGSGESIIPK